jgi:hypothetical protein
MPVPKGKQKLYGMIVGHNINIGHSLESAKNIADKAITNGKSKKKDTDKEKHKDNSYIVGNIVKPDKMKGY